MIIMVIRLAGILSQCSIMIAGHFLLLEFRNPCSHLTGLINEIIIMQNVTMCSCIIGI
jgi:hypothetical protein